MVDPRDYRQIAVTTLLFLSSPIRCWKINNASIAIIDKKLNAFNVIFTFLSFSYFFSRDYLTDSRKNKGSLWEKNKNKRNRASNTHLEYELIYFHALLCFFQVLTVPELHPMLVYFDRSWIFRHSNPVDEIIPNKDLTETESAVHMERKISAD